MDNRNVEMTAACKMQVKNSILWKCVACTLPGEWRITKLVYGSRLS